tara:strand:- start:37 stop:336 length:300 start_codon:yes stop_codon:yes gene_type:complete
MVSGRTVLFVAALTGIAALTKPSAESLRRQADKAASDEAGGGVIGWAAGKIAKAAFLLALENGAYKVHDLGVATVITPTSSLASAGEEGDWIFIGLFST